jgi:hypothetical protein
MDRKLLLALIAMVLVMLAASAAWFVGANRFEAALDDWLAARQAEGVDVHFEAKRISGFPVGFFATLVNPSITAKPGAAGPQGWSWRAPELTFGYHVFSSELRLSAAGPHDVERHSGDKIDRLRLETTAFTVVMPRRKSDDREVDVAATMAKLTVDAFSLSAASLNSKLFTHRIDAGNHLGDAGDLDLEFKGLGTAIGGVALSSASVDGAITARWLGAVPPGRLKEGLAAWRDDGGTIEISHASFQSGPVDIQGSGTLALDAEMRPLGAFATEIKGYDAVVDQLVADGRVSAKNADFARAVLASMAQTDGVTGLTKLALPISIQDGWLSVGPARLVKIAPLPLD